MKIGTTDPPRELDRCFTLNVGAPVGAGGRDAAPAGLVRGDAAGDEVGSGEVGGLPHAETSIKVTIQIARCGADGRIGTLPRIGCETSIRGY